tara:strand:- start:64 stop:342 length:279 start_codon:yes stop_codon:yes gene_type:complete
MKMKRIKISQGHLMTSSLARRQRVHRLIHLIRLVLPLRTRKRLKRIKRALTKTTQTTETTEISTGITMRLTTVTRTCFEGHKVKIIPLTNLI